MVTLPDYPSQSGNAYKGNIDENVANNAPIKGADLTSANPLVIGTDGNYFVVTDNTNFAGMTVATNRNFTLEFSGTPTITVGSGITLNNAGDNYTVAAGDIIECQSTAADTVTGRIIKADGTSVVASSVPVNGAKSVQVFTSSGTWTKPAGIKSILVELVGGGGGGGGVPATAYTSAGGGGGGGYASKIIDVSAISSVSVTRGNGGSGGSTSGTVGSPGGTTSFGAHCSGAGGSGGQAGTTAYTNRYGGNGGAGTDGDVNADGQKGGPGCGEGSDGDGGGSRLSLATAGAGWGYGATSLIEGSGGGGGRTKTATGKGGGPGKSGLVIVWEFE